MQRVPARSADQADEYQALFRIIEASIADLPEADQKRYEQLAVFAGRGPFPRDSARHVRNRLLAMQSAASLDRRL